MLTLVVLIPFVLGWNSVITLLNPSYGLPNATLTNHFFFPSELINDLP